MSLPRAKTVDQYVDWIQQAVFEIGDLKDCLLYEVETLTSFPAFIEPIETGINKVFQDMKDGTYHFGREDFTFMETALAHAEEIPFLTLIKQINETHRKGLDIDED